jgi:BlaI family penicillinase repressor
MPKSPQISDSEWLIMKALWARSPLTASEVCETLTDIDWKISTVKTLLARLVEKGALNYEPRGREYLYSPAIKEADAIRSETGSFIERIFGGSVAPMLAHFVEEHNLTDAQIAELRKVLDAAQKKSRHEKKGKKS